MLAVVPFKTSDEGGAWESPRAAIVEADTSEEAIEKFVEACVYPYADPIVWGEVADKGSAPDRTEDGHFYIAYADEESDGDGETVCIHFEILKVALFENEEEAEDYRDGFHTYEWAFDDRT